MIHRKLGLVAGVQQGWADWAYQPSGKHDKTYKIERHPSSIQATKMVQNFLIGFVDTHVTSHW